MTQRVPVTQTFEEMGRLVRSRADEDTLLKLAYETFLKRDCTFNAGERKDLAIAEVNKHVGNFHFQKNSFGEALIHYNAGIIKCPQGTAKERELLSVLVANRSAVFLEIEEYEKVLKDIAFIEDLKSYPVHLNYKLSWRKAKCYESLQNSEKANGEYAELLKMLKENCSLAEAERQDKIKSIEALQRTEMSRERKPRRPELKMLEDVEFFKGGEKYVAASPSIDISYDDKNGRHAVALEDIPVGSVILKEEAHVTVLLGTKALTHCQHCLAAVDQLFPCPECANVVFCSMACQKIALESYHGIECPIYGSLQECGSNIFLVLRIITQKGFSFFNNQKCKLLECLENKLDLGISQKDVYRHDDYDNIMFLYRKDRHSDEFEVYVLYSTSFLLRALKQTNFYPFETQENILKDEELFFGKLIFRHCKMANYNVHGLGEIKRLERRIVLRNGMESSFEMARLGAGLFPTYAFFNHSCDPSVIRTNINRMMFVRTIKPIRAGDIIYDNYGYHYLWAPWQERQKNLQSVYCFKCTCTPCEEKWPCVEKLQPIVMVPCRRKSCGNIISVTRENPNPERCNSCHRRLHQDAITSITAPIRKSLAKAKKLYEEKKFEKALKMFIRVLQLMYKYTNKPDLEIARVQDSIDFCMAHFGNKSIDYWE